MASRTTGDDGAFRGRYRPARSSGLPSARPILLAFASLIPSHWANAQSPKDASRG